MYTPGYARNDNREELLAFMQAHPFAMLVSSNSASLDSPLFVTHLPLVVVDGERMRISGHVARANPHGRVLHETTALAVFHGPHAYISPSAYDSRQSVPTWNYVAVHASGKTSLIDDEELRRARLEELVLTTDPAYQAQWRELPASYQTNMLNGIVAFDLWVDRLEGQFKLSGNKTTLERERIADTLMHAPDTAVQDVGRMMRDRNGGASSTR